MAQCPVCQEQFFCGAALHPAQPCWCSRLPPLASASLAASAQCYCPTCLQRLLEQEQTAAASKPGAPA
ncbi:MAG: cysteine-rich CWC family protein [Collimonas sp.]|uniref:cysteine-rich CWC family protein n=1 Tax=Collimonas sp. TaxID=1963772 RepID=UPI0032639EED